MKYRMQLLKEAYNNRAIDILVDRSNEKSEDYLALLREKLIEELAMPYNALPFRDSRGKLYQTKNVILTRKGLKEIFANQFS